MESYSLRHKINALSGFLGFVLPTYFAWQIYRQNIPQNVATWGLVFVLDFLGLVLAWRAGNRRPYLQIGWTIASVAILTAIALNSHVLKWTIVETSSVLMCFVAIYIWVTKSAKKALYAYIIALFISCIPLAVDYWNEPLPETAWLWFATIGTCLLSVYGAEERNFASTAIPWAALIINAIFAVLCFL